MRELVFLVFIGMVVSEGVTPGHLSKEICKKYAPDSNNCPLVKQSVKLGNNFAEEKEFPHMAILGYRKKGEISWSCAASLITDQYILTAAHCLNTRSNGNPVAAKLGATNLNKTDHAEEIRIAEVFAHPGYNPPSVYDNIALVKLERKVSINDYVRPACLYTEKEIGVAQAINTGWGSLTFGTGFEDTLQKVGLELYDQESCNETYRSGIPRTIKYGITYDTMVCAGTKQELSLQPQSGGPLLINHKDDGNLGCLYDIVGVSSFGKPETAPNVPSVYTRVSAYVDWIEKIISN